MLHQFELYILGSYGIMNDEDVWVLGKMLVM